MSREAVPYSELIHRAMEFAASAHEGHFRKDRDARIPYFSHCAMVGRILEQAGYDEEVVAAGILHDTVEDTDVSLETLADRFGARVADLVSQVTEQDKSLPWEDRKARYLARLGEAPVEALAISCADKLHNIRSLIISRRKGGEVWEILNRGREDQLERLDRIAALFREGLRHPLQEAFEAALKTLKEEC